MHLTNYSFKNVLQTVLPWISQAYTRCSVDGCKHSLSQL